MSLSINQILHISRSGMMTRMLDLDLVSHNLANVNTVGFKTNRSNFQEMLNSKLYNGIQLKATQKFFEQGAFRTTSNSLDLAINGKGFFSVTLPDGRLAYTRDGQFDLDANRQLVNSNGFPVVWDGSIPEDATDVNIEQDGSVMVQQAGVWNQVGTLQLAKFPNPNGLDGFGDNMWVETEVSGAVITGAPASEGFGDIRDHTVEQSNVNIANEISQMVILQRSFDMSLRVFQATDEMMGQAIMMRRY